MKILFLMGPAFMRMGLDVMDKLFARAMEDIQITVLNSGNERHHNKIVSRFSDNIKVLNLFDLEAKWFTQNVSVESQQAFQSKFSAGVFGRTILSDRRICGSLVDQPIRRSLLPADWKTDDACQRYVCNLYSDLEKLVAGHDLVFCYSVAGAPAFSLGEIARRNGTAFRQLVPLRIENYYGLDTDTDNRLVHCTQLSVTQEARIKAESFLSTFRARPKPPEYQLAQTGPGSPGIRARQFSAAKRLAQKAVDFLRRPSFERRLRMINQAQQLSFEFYAGRDLKRLARQEEALPPRFWYFPLQVEPEASTMVLAPWFSNQIMLIELLAKALPAGVRLLVKEHPSMVGRRKGGFYDHIDALPNVTLVNPMRSQFGLISATELNIVNTGTTALEALMMDRPFAVVAQNYLSTFFPENSFTGQLDSLPIFLSKCAEMPMKPDKDILDMIGRLLSKAFKVNSSAMWGGASEVETKELDRLADQLLEAALTKLVPRG